MWTETNEVQGDSGREPAPSGDVFTEHAAQNVTVLRLTGPLVRQERAMTLRKRVRELVAEGTTHLAIDLADVPYIDSSGVGGLAAVYNAVREAGGRVKFCCLSRNVLHTLQTVHLDRVLELFDNQASAVLSF